MRCEEGSCRDLFQKHVHCWGFGISGVEPSDPATGQLISKMDLSEKDVKWEVCGSGSISCPMTASVQICVA